MVLGGSHDQRCYPADCHTLHLAAGGFGGILVFHLRKRSIQVNYQTVTHCQVCNSADLVLRFDAGFQPLVNDLHPITEPLRPTTFYPTQLLECQQCNLVQLGIEVDSSILFPPTYPYRSGTTKALKDNFTDLAKELATLFGIGKDDFVIDVGANDGSLLEAVRSVTGVEIAGIEPTEAWREAERKGIPMWREFLAWDTAESVVAAHRQAKVVTCTNCFAHVPDVHDFVKCVLTMLAPGGVFVTESHYLPSLMEELQLDVCYHEHLRYYSLTSLQYLFKQHGLVIVHAKEIPTHGGSIRVYAMREGEAVDLPTYYELLLVEETPLQDQRETPWQRFNRRVGEAHNDFWSMMFSHDRLFGIGAPSRSTTLIHYLGLSKASMECVCEVKGSPKIGSYVPGTNIPILDEEILYREQPPFALLLSWHLKDHLVPLLRAKGYRGEIICPLPEPTVVA